MEDREILDCIRGLVAEEHWLRQRRDQGELGEDVEVRRLPRSNAASISQGSPPSRRAMRAAGLNLSLADERPSFQAGNPSVPPSGPAFSPPRV
jgi:hypothetical protein